MPFSGTRLNDDRLGVARAGYCTVPITTIAFTDGCSPFICSPLLQGLSTLRLAARISPRDRSLLPGASALTRTGLAPARTSPLSGRTMLRIIAARVQAIAAVSGKERTRKNRSGKHLRAESNSDLLPGRQVTPRDRRLLTRDATAENVDLKAALLRHLHR